MANLTAKNYFYDFFLNFFFGWDFFAVNKCCEPSS